VSVADELAPKLAAVLEPALGAGTSIEDLRTLTGGASRTTWAFDAVTGGQRRSLILRTGPPDEVHAGMELEASAQRAAAAAGAPVPHIVVADDSVVALGNPFLICNAIGGETIVRRIHRQLDDAGRARLLRQCAEALAAIHRADTNLPGVSHDDQMAEWRDQLDTMGDTTATFEWAFRWLADNRPAPSPPRLVHGDYRLDNMIVAADAPTIIAVLDWELSTLGDPLADFSYHLMQWHMPHSEAGTGSLAGFDLGALGIPSLDAYIDLYVARTSLDPRPHLPVYFAYNFFRLAAIMQGIAGRVRDGTATSAVAASKAQAVRPLAVKAFEFASQAGA